MRLLLDQNLAPRLVEALAEVYPDSAHVRALGLERSDDLVVWHFAASHGYTIVSKDADFRQLSFTLGFPPKVIWIRLGNCSTAQIENLLRTRAAQVAEFERDPEAALLGLGS